MEFKGTQGEWKIKNTISDLATNICVGKTRIAEVKHYFGEGFPDDPKKEEGTANAKLIAASPDLLKACIEFLKKCDNGTARSVKSYKQMSYAVNKALN